MNMLVLAALMMSAEPAAGMELDYKPGALAYGALVQGDLSLAEQQLRASQEANRNDPAWLLNYGQLLARQGRVNEANAVFRRVALAPDTEVVLASGEVIGSRAASRLAERKLRAVNLSAR
jgi:Tfp pilus assembly protein PilF